MGWTLLIIGEEVRNAFNTVIGPDHIQVNCHEKYIDYRLRVGKQDQILILQFTFQYMYNLYMIWPIMSWKWKASVFENLKYTYIGDEN